MPKSSAKKLAYNKQWRKDNPDYHKAYRERLGEDAKRAYSRRANAKWRGKVPGGFASGSPWTVDDVNVLVEMAGASAAEAAERLGRSVNAITSMRARLRQDAQAVYRRVAGKGGS